MKSTETEVCNSGHSFFLEGTSWSRRTDGSRSAQFNFGVLCVCLICLTVCGCTSRQSPKFLTYAGSDLELIPGEYLVMFDSTVVSEIAVPPLANSLVAGTKGKIDYIFTKSLHGFSAKGLTDAWADTVSRRGDVSLVRKNFRIYGKELRGGAFAPVPWNLDRVDQRSPFTLDRDYRFKTGNIGTAPPVPIYILDNGVYRDHAEFKDPLGNSRVENIADVTNQNFARCLDTGASHGTGVASIAAGLSLGITSTVIKNVKVLDREPTLGGCTGGSATTVAMGLDRTFQDILNNGIDKAVVNLSFGWYAPTPDVAAQILNLQNKNVVIVAAAGNEDRDAAGFLPANLPNVLAVGATSESDARATFSNFGSTVSLWAPGSNIKIADWTTANNTTATALASGTSEAAPHVAGAVALLWQQNPNMSSTQVMAALKARSTRNMLTGLGAGSTNTLLYVGEDAPAQGQMISIPRSGKNGDLLAVRVAWDWKRLYVVGGDVSGTGANSGPFAYAGFDNANLGAGPLWEVANVANPTSQDCIDIATTGLGTGGSGSSGFFAYFGCAGTQNGSREAVVIATREDHTLLWPQPAWLGPGSTIRGVTAGSVEVPGGVQLLVFAIWTHSTPTGTEVSVTSLDMNDGHQVGTVVLTDPAFTEQFHQAVDLVLVDSTDNNGASTDLVATTYSDPPGPDKTFLWRLSPHPLKVLAFREVPVPQLATNGMFATALVVQGLEDNGNNIRVPGEVFLATQTAVVDGGRTVPWGYIFRLNPDRVTVHSTIEVVKEAYISSLWSEDGDLYFAGNTTRTFPSGNLFGISKPGSNPDYDAFLGKSEGVINTRRWMVTFNPAGAQPNSGYGAYGAKQGYIVGSDWSNFYVVKYPIY